MHTALPRIDDEHLGIRAFHLSRQKAVERALERMRHGLGSAWAELAPSDREHFAWIAGELWAAQSRSEWEDLHFSRLTLHDTLAIVALSRQLRRRAIPKVATLRQVANIMHVARCRA